MTRFIVLCGLVFIGAFEARATDFHVFYLGGQSNMDGFGAVSELPDDLQGEVTGVPIFHGNPAADAAPVDGQGIWTTLKPGHGWQFTTDGATNAYSQKFGPELTFGRTMQELLPGKRVALIKYSRGGTSLDEAAAGPFGCWEPDFEQGAGEGQGINQYDHFLATIRAATAVRDVDGDGVEDRLLPAGIVWMQGESDAAYTPEIAENYESHLKRLMDLIRAALREDDVPVVIARISDSRQGDNNANIWQHGEVVRAAQAAFVENDGHAALVTSTDGYGYSDPYHYDTAGYIDLGRQMAQAMEGLLEQSDTK
jgi:hypothetical protein